MQVVTTNLLSTCSGNLWVELSDVQPPLLLYMDTDLPLETSQAQAQRQCTGKLEKLTGQRNPNEVLLVGE